MNLGYACINVELRQKGVFCSRTCRKNNFSLNRASNLATKNTEDLIKILEWNSKNKIKLFRVPSNIFPFIDHPELSYKIGDLPNSRQILDNLETAGKIARKSQQRLTTHPGQYTVLSSSNSLIRKKSIQTILHHVELLDILNSIDPVINIHIGGNLSPERGQNFCRSVDSLPWNARKKLSVENDDKINGWSVRNLYNRIWYFTGVPIVLDIHHWYFCHENDASLNNDFISAKYTWKCAKRRQKLHYSESKNACGPAHSNFVEGPLPSFSNGTDVMIEAKMKEKALQGLSK